MRTLEINEHFRDVEFVKVEKPNKPMEDAMLNLQKERNLRVQSVFLPENFVERPSTEEDTINWLQNKIKNNNTATYILQLKYQH